jgi:hypothetical protein
MQEAWAKMTTLPSGCTKNLTRSPGFSRRCLRIAFGIVSCPSTVIADSLVQPERSNKMRHLKYRQLFVLSATGSGVFSANMGCKISIPPLLVVLLHFIERLTGGCARRIEHPCAFGTTPAEETLFFDPYQFAAHELLSTLCDLPRFCFFERRCGIGT